MKKIIKFSQVTKWIENLFEVKIRSNCRIPSHSLTCHWIRIASIVLCLDLQSLPTHVSEAEKSWGHLEVGDEYHILGWVENKDVWNCSGVRFARSLLFLFALRPFYPSITLSCKVNTQKNPSQSPPLQSDGCSGHTSNFLWSKRPKQPSWLFTKCRRISLLNKLIAVTTALTYVIVRDNMAALSKTFEATTDRSHQH